MLVIPSALSLSASCLVLLLAICILNVNSYAQPTPYLARPVESFEGDAIVFSYLANKDGATPLENIASWRWDFDGDVQDTNNPSDPGWDEAFTVGNNDPTTGLPITASRINTTWYATYNEDEAVDGVQVITPTLQITLTSEAGGATITQTGITENVIGPVVIDSGTGLPVPDSTISIRSRAVGNADLILNFTANPRLAKAAEIGPPAIAAETVRLYSNPQAVGARAIDSASYLWQFTNTSGGTSPADSTDANPRLENLEAGSYDVSLTVDYTVSYLNAAGDTLTSSGTLTETKQDFFRVVAVPESLQLGRAYRRGFPDTLGWEDIIDAYQAPGPGNDRYVYFKHLENAFFQQQADLTGNSSDPDEQQQMAEDVNELIQGQLLVANDRLIEALRIKYPRLAESIDPEDPSQRLNPPAGTRSETSAIDQALLDYLLPVYHASTSLQVFGTGILRNRAPQGAEPYPQFPQYLTFEDPSLSQAPIPVKNEFWQLTTLFEREGLGRVEKAKKLWRLSAQEPEALGEAKQECKVAGHHGYLSMALLASGQSVEDYNANEGNGLLAHVKNARNLFEMINAGVNPLGNDGSFIPNESFAAIYQDAQEAVGDAREAEINARQEERTWDRYQAELRSEHLNQRASYLTPLKNLTSIDPALYNNLNTIDDQRDYREVVQVRLESLLQDYPNANPAILGETGEQVINVLDAGLALEQASNELQNLYKRVDLARWANAEINSTINETTQSLRSIDVALGLMEGLLHDRKGTTVSIGALVAGAVRGVLNSQRTALQALQSMQINDVQLEKEIRGLLLEAANLGINIQRSNNNLRQAQLRLDNQLARMDRLIVDLAHTRETAADLYFQDPSFRIVVSDAMRRAEAELDYAVDRLYRLAKTLEYDWTEPYQNPVTIPVSSYEDASLENPLFDKFTQIDSLFFIRGADEAKDYLDALKAWDSKLRRINGSSVRGPNHSGPISAEPISLREDILNFRPDPDRGYTLEDSIADFRNFLETQRTENFFNVANPSLQTQFQTTIEDNRFFPATGSRWNMRLNSIGADVYAESGFSNKQVVEIDLIQTGTVSLRRFYADPPYADDLMKLTFNAPDLDRTAFAIAFPAKINGATGNRPASEFINLGLQNRPVAATNWVLRIDTESPTNGNVDLTKIKDLVLNLTYTYGNPPEFPGF